MKRIQAYWAFGMIAYKQILVYASRMWLSVFISAVTTLIFAYFWRAIYSGTDQIAGLGFQQVLNYALIALFIERISPSSLLSYIGDTMQQGEIGLELLRPLDLQLSQFARMMVQCFLLALINLPLLLLGFLLGLQLPVDPLTWMVFLITLLLAFGIRFVYDWAFSCLGFYTTDTWGLTFLQYGILRFFSGTLLPIPMMPALLQNIALVLPFAQTIYLPVGILSGTIPLDQAPAAWIGQALWLIGLTIFSRWVFHRAVRLVTVQGG
jgi:ABC-2 type transport system permease protein